MLRKLELASPDFERARNDSLLSLLGRYDAHFFIVVDAVNLLINDLELRKLAHQLLMVVLVHCLREFFLGPVGIKDARLALEGFAS